MPRLFVELSVAMVVSQSLAWERPMIRTTYLRIGKVTQEGDEMRGQNSLFSLISCLTVQKANKHYFPNSVLKNIWIDDVNCDDVKDDITKTVYKCKHNGWDQVTVPKNSPTSTCKTQNYAGSANKLQSSRHKK